MHKGPDDHDFVDASGGSIRNHGKCLTKLTDGQGRQVLTQWRGAEVTRALHSVSNVTGDEAAELGDHDVLFNNKRCVAVPPQASSSRS